MDVLGGMAVLLVFQAPVPGTPQVRVVGGGCCLLGGSAGWPVACGFRIVLFKLNFFYPMQATVRRPSRCLLD